jgi:hypothetical protein
MSDDIINHLMRRLDRIEAVQASFRSPDDSAIDRMAEAMKGIAARLSVIEGAVEKGNATAQLAVTTAQLEARLKRLIDNVQNGMVEVVSDSVVSSEKLMARQTDEKLGAVRADAAAAKAAASANITTAQKLILDYASQLGS